MASETTTLPVNTRTPGHSRETRRLRRAGQVPGVIYGGDGEPTPIQVEARTLRNALAHSGAVLDVEIDGGSGDSVIVKEVQRHPVRGEALHVDLLRVRMDVAIQTTVVIELVGAEDSPGVDQGGVLSQEHREVTIESLPGDIPDAIQFDVSKLEMNATAHLSELVPPPGVTVVDDPEIVIATITPPTVEPVEEELEVETERVGEAGEAGEAKAEGDTAEEAGQSAADSGGDES